MYTSIEILHVWSSITKPHVDDVTDYLLLSLDLILNVVL